MTANRFLRKRMPHILAAIVCAVTLGCRDNSTPAVPAAPAAPMLAPDEKVLLVLDCFDPLYTVDANGRVINLRLTGRHLPTAVLAEIGKLSEVRGLNFYGASVTDEGLAQLKDLQKLRSITLGGTAITDQGLVHLEKLQSLKWLWLPKQTVTKAGVEKLKDARPDMNVRLH
jgi:hypothetical protein